MITIVFVGGILFLTLAFFLIFFVKKSQRKNWKMDESIHRSIGVQGYVFITALIMIGLYLIMIGIKETKTTEESKNKGNDKVIIYRRK